MAELNQIKNRIKTVGGVAKVTSAMKLVSTVKLQRWKNKMLNNREYSLSMKEITNLVLSDPSIKETSYSKVNEKATKSLFIIVSSTLGLCGSYNYNIFDLAGSKIQKDDDAVILGKNITTNNIGIIAKIILTHGIPFLSSIISNSLREGNDSGLSRYLSIPGLCPAPTTAIT